MSKSLSAIGATRHLTPVYADIKKSVMNWQKRPTFSDSRSSLNENGKTKLLVANAKGPIELKSTMLVPEYIELFEKTTDLFQDILITRLQEEQQKRVTPKFNDEENRSLDKRIFVLVEDITNKMKQCEKNIKQIGVLYVDSPSERSMKENIKIYLAGKLQDISKKVKINEEAYINRFKEFCSSDLKNNYNSSDRLENIQENKGSFLDLDKSDELLRQRESEINKLVHSINDLAQIFQDMSSLVHIGGKITLKIGTIIDRIDYNIEASVQNTKKANEHLFKAEKNMETNCARNSIFFLLIIIFVESVLLLLKFAK